MTLPVELKFHDDEPPVSFASRLAAANGYGSVNTMLDLMGTSMNGVLANHSTALATLSEWAGVETDQRMRFPSPLAGSSNSKLGRAIIKLKTGRKLLRLCACCIVDDLSRESGKEMTRPRLRSWWQVEEVENCPTHLRPLVRFRDVFRTIDLDFTRMVQRDLHKIEALALQALALPCAGSSLDAYVVNRIIGANDGGFLDGLDAQVAAEFARYLGQDLAKAGVLVEENADPRDVGYHFARLGEASVKKTISEVLIKARPAVTGFGVYFRSVASWLRRKTEDPAYSSVVDLVHAAAVENTPVGRGDRGVGSISKRHLHSVMSAAEDYELPRARVRSIVAGAGLLMGGQFSDERACFVLDIAHPLLESARKHLRVSEVADLLGTQESEIDRLLKGACELPPHELADRRGNPVIRVLKVDLERFEARLKACIGTDHDTILVPASRAANDCRTTVAGIVSMILEGEIREVGRACGASLVGGLLVNPVEVRQAVARFDLELSQKWKRAAVAIPLPDNESFVTLRKRGGARSRNKPRVKKPSGEE